MSTLIAGFGNELRADDGAGLAVVREIARRTLPADVRCAEIGIGGIALLHELLAGCDRLVIADAVRRGGAPGTMYVLTPVLPEGDDPLAAHAALADAHFAEPYAALVLARSLGVLPREISIVGIEAGDVDELTSEMTPAVARAVPVAAERALEIAVATREAA